ncbi:efflux system membrane protein [compost metagenome]|jgi:hypothetical protein|uniref:DUF1656 domain-containing protein n=1 Tax=Cupriavidus campinensis TaxID=151783 RepID=A0AAE9I948_9BURK|nr:MULTISPECIES: DUF1656 domain-containing protein [Cupriavidus]TSP11994.1 DUF1656 domain-containing protein [Cupriavidus campinensis]URF06351.1 DUF1656 domain-containing protein [Cupriavidus campinensis]CAG2130193.1 hypothetical protein LMG19282_00300 [Cupriavidus campinensis]SFC93610.1 Protein of unknown function [Cupriavidus sp. OV038]SFP58115.1 Protein of unknown function [Cupriavidus sp. OV096]
MPGEFSLYGVFIPSLLVWMLAAFAITSGARAVLTRLGFYKLVWHRSLFNLALYAIVLGGVVAVVPWFQS